MKTDVLIIGSGLAGLYTALHIDRGLSVLFVTKESMDESSSWLAQGGIAAAVSKDDTPEYHMEDTLAAGAGLCDGQAVRVLAAEGPEDIRRLVDMRVPFDIDGEGDLAITREGGHTRKRVVHAGGDATGRETVRVLMKLVMERQNVTFLGNCFATGLLTRDGAVFGAAALIDGKPETIQARFTVLATGGLGQIYGKTTNPSVSTGDGFALALRAGAELRDMEFVQFHPTGLYDPERGGNAFLITEAMRGEGAVLRNAEGERFTQELAPRDILSRAIIAEMARGRQECVYLDTSPIQEERFRQRFPTVYGECVKRGVSTSRIPVCPVQHYQVGGIRVDLYARTAVPGLYAVGEVSCTGVHGANRLASNSMLECLVFGRRAAEAINSEQLTVNSGTADVVQTSSDSLPPEMQRHIRAVCDRYAGVVRTFSGLKQGLGEMEAILSRTRDSNAREWLETRNMALSARAVLSAALNRRESVGTHFINGEGVSHV
ncbi:MAG: L-aspartate oxidase [Oscillospiraceae bacterium]|jgi:L-aspartate oxidase|nr:L-aspartate oxidase [Oscillospiraceae bacterium]